MVKCYCQMWTSVVTIVLHYFTISSHMSSLLYQAVCSTIHQLHWKESHASFYLKYKERQWSFSILVDKVFLNCFACKHQEQCCWLPCPHTGSNSNTVACKVNVSCEGISSSWMCRDKWKSKDWSSWVPEFWAQSVADADAATQIHTHTVCQCLYHLVLSSNQIWWLHMLLPFCSSTVRCLWQQVFWPHTDSVTQRECCRWGS